MSERQRIVPRYNDRLRGSISSREEEIARNNIEISEQAKKMGLAEILEEDGRTTGVWVDRVFDPRSNQLPKRLFLQQSFIRNPELLEFRLEFPIRNQERLTEFVTGLRQLQMRLPREPTFDGLRRFLAGVIGK